MADEADLIQDPPVAAGQTWYGRVHGSAWMVFDSERYPGLFDLWCVDGGTSTTWSRGAIAGPFTGEHISRWLDSQPSARIDTTALRSWTSIT